MSLLTLEGLAELIFLGMVGVTMFGALLATNAKRLPRAVSGLAICFIGMAGLYYFLNSPFVALMEILIYVGAVCVTIVFAVMLADPDAEKDSVRKRNALVGPLSAGMAGLLIWGLSLLALKTMWPAPAAKLNDGSITEIGHALLTRYSMVFELISVVLLMAIIGALVLARTGRDAR